MILLVDIGNTQIKWAILQANQIEGCKALQHQGKDLSQLLSAHWQALSKPSQILVANVAGKDIEDQLSTWTQQHWNIEPQFELASATFLGVRNAYAEPQKLGIDRWMGLMAAWKFYGGPLCVIGCGTGITVDAINQQGDHLGGLIAPGIQLMRLSLAEHTAGCPLTANSIQIHKTLLANNTQDAINNGCITMAAAFINQATQDITEKLGNKVNYIITGGNVETLLPLLDITNRVYQHRPYLVLEGLAILVDNNH